MGPKLLDITCMVSQLVGIIKLKGVLHEILMPLSEELWMFIWNWKIMTLPVTLGKLLDFKKKQQTSDACGC